MKRIILLSIFVVFSGCKNNGEASNTNSSKKSGPTLPGKKISKTGGLRLRKVFSALKQKNDTFQTGSILKMANVLVPKECDVKGFVKAYEFSDKTGIRGAFLYIIHEKYNERCASDDVEPPVVCAFGLGREADGNEVLSLIYVKSIEGPLENLKAGINNFGKGAFFATLQYETEGEEANPCSEADSRHIPVKVQDFFHLGTTIKHVHSLELTLEQKMSNSSISQEAKYKLVPLKKPKTFGLYVFNYSIIIEEPGFKRNDDGDSDSDSDVKCNREIQIFWFDKIKRVFVHVKKKVELFKKNNPSLHKIPDDASGTSDSNCEIIKKGGVPPDDEDEKPSNTDDEGRPTYNDGSDPPEYDDEI